MFDKVELSDTPADRIDPLSRNRNSRPPGSTVLSPRIIELKQHEVACDMFVNEVEGEQLVPQVIKNAHEDHEIKLLSKLANVIG